MARLVKANLENEESVYQALQKLVREDKIAIQTKGNRTVTRLTKRGGSAFGTSLLREDPDRFMMEYKQRCFLNLTLYSL